MLKVKLEILSPKTQKFVEKKTIFLLFGSSKHLKCQLGPTMSDVRVFLTKEVSWGPLVCYENLHYKKKFLKMVSLGPPCHENEQFLKLCLFFCVSHFDCLKTVKLHSGFR